MCIYSASPVAILASSIDKMKNEGDITVELIKAYIDRGILTIETLIEDTGYDELDLKELTPIK